MQEWQEEDQLWSWRRLRLLRRPECTSSWISISRLLRAQPHIRSGRRALARRRDEVECYSKCKLGIQRRWLLGESLGYAWLPRGRQSR